MKRSKLKRKLRKKNHVGEFQELGFEIKVRLKEGLTETEFDTFTHYFILEAIEKTQLMFGGGGDSIKWEGYASSAKKYNSPTNDQKEKVRNWLEKREEVAEFHIGDFRDAWYGWD